MPNSCVLLFNRPTYIKLLSVTLEIGKASRFKQKVTKSHKMERRPLIFYEKLLLPGGPSLKMYFYQMDFRLIPFFFYIIRIMKCGVTQSSMFLELLEMRKTKFFLSLVREEFTNKPEVNKDNSCI